MKKLLTVITVIALAVSMTGIAVSAHGGHHGRRQRGSDVKIVYHCTEDCTYCDNDGDGICDECGNYGYCCEKDCSYIDEDGDGICDNCDTKGVCSYKSKKVRRGHCHH